MSYSLYYITPALIQSNVRHIHKCIQLKNMSNSANITLGVRTCLALGEGWGGHDKKPRGIQLSWRRKVEKLYRN